MSDEWRVVSTRPHTTVSNQARPRNRFPGSDRLPGRCGSQGSRPAIVASNVDLTGHRGEHTTSANTVSLRVGSYRNGSHSEAFSNACVVPAWLQMIPGKCGYAPHLQAKAERLSPHKPERPCRYETHPVFLADELDDVAAAGYGWRQAAAGGGSVADHVEVVESGQGPFHLHVQVVAAGEHPP